MNLPLPLLFTFIFLQICQVSGGKKRKQEHYEDLKMPKKHFDKVLHKVYGDFPNQPNIDPTLMNALLQKHYNDPENRKALFGGSSSTAQEAPANQAGAGASGDEPIYVEPLSVRMPGHMARPFKTNQFETDDPVEAVRHHYSKPENRKALLFGGSSSMAHGAHAHQAGAGASVNAPINVESLSAIRPGHMAEQMLPHPWKAAYNQIKIDDPVEVLRRETRQNQANSKRSKQDKEPWKIPLTKTGRVDTAEMVEQKDGFFLLDTSNHIRGHEVAEQVPKDPKPAHEIIQIDDD